MKKLYFILLLMFAIRANAQNYILKPGDYFPDITIRPIINAPISELFLNKYASTKLIILNFWGTWCSPCIPEMDALAKLQAKYNGRIQVIGVSDESTGRLRKYLVKKPTPVWLASDTASLLYNMLNLKYVGQSLVINSKHQVLALMKTESINADTLDKFLKGEKVASNGEVKDQLSKTEKDPFGVDSLQDASFTIRTYMKGQESMSKHPNRGVFAGRRVTYFNLGLGTLYRDAYDIHTMNQMVYEVDKKLYDDYNDKNKLYCFDLLVKPSQKDSLLLIMQRKLQESMPLKARVEQREMDVYVMRLKTPGAINVPESKMEKMSYGFSGRGFDGTGVTFPDFAKLYLSNELQLPVVDETGLAKRYDIKTIIDLRTKESIMKSITDLGLTVEKEKRKMKTVILYKD